MKKIFFVLLSVMMLSSCNMKTNTDVKIQSVSPIPTFNENNVDKQEKIKGEVTDYTPLNFDEQKAVWISYIDLADMFVGGTKTDFSQAFSQACENVKDLGCNTIYVHVRSFSDAYYSSDYFPWTKGITGEFDVAPNYDPLEIMVNTAHNYGLSFHAWINPLRSETAENLEKINDDYAIKQWYNDSETYSEYLVSVDNDAHYWLNPAIADVRELIYNGVEEIVENYDVDAIHIDDYFYPTTETYFDEDSYVSANVDLSLSDWRLDNCSILVKGIYDTVKSQNSQVLFGVSPQGNLQNNYALMFADVEKWCSEAGYIDYIVPQVYFGYENSDKPFQETIDEWSSVVTCDEVSLIIGLAPYKIGDDSEFANTVGIIANQISSSRELSNYSGVAFYNYKNLFVDDSNLAERLEDEREKISKII